MRRSDSLGCLHSQASSLTIAERAGEIIRDVMARGELGVVDKVLLTSKAKAKPLNLHKFSNPFTLQGQNNDFDPQTEADRSSQKCIIASLSKQYSNLKIIGEEGECDLNDIPPEFIVNEMNQEFLNKYKCPESLKNIAESDLVVWVDPLDGTSEYVHGFLEHVTVLIGK
jgi:3'(2'), 5'-bisphosphate nucleotidase